MEMVKVSAVKLLELTKRIAFFDHAYCCTRYGIVVPFSHAAERIALLRQQHVITLFELVRHGESSLGPYTKSNAY